jgi:hypothetical protein
MRVVVHPDAARDAARPRRREPVPAARARAMVGTRLAPLQAMSSATRRDSLRVRLPRRVRRAG